MEFYQNEEPNLIRRISGWVVDVVVALAFAWFCLTFFGTQVTMNGQSMQPLIDSGDVVLMKDVYKRQVKEQGDIFYDGDSEYILQKYFSRGTSAPRDY